MGPVYRFFQLLLYYPSLLVIFYIYAVFGISFRSRLSRTDYWFSIRTSFKKIDIRSIFTGVIKNWKNRRRHK
uniref:Uncharacterized protein n=1 Tax=Pecluma dulcis TaxID=253784 RepID=A0A5B9RBD1_9MONI|nr:hypothetical protein [Pecluma dulcis]QEG57682.1 hypothetical protein [Pecluma dulcis]